MSKKPLHKQKTKKGKSEFSAFSNPHHLTASLDLHRARNLEEVSFLVDKFLVDQRLRNLNKIKQKGQIRLGIIVGLGNNSKRLIGGKNPLRHFVESYLAQTDINWKNALNLDNSVLSGLIIVELE